MARKTAKPSNRSTSAPQRYLDPNLFRGDGLASLASRIYDWLRTAARDAKALRPTAVSTRMSAQAAALADALVGTRELGSGTRSRVDVAVERVKVVFSTSFAGGLEMEEGTQASALREARSHAELVASVFADFLAETETNFDAPTFFRECGLSEKFVARMVKARIKHVVAQSKELGAAWRAAERAAKSLAKDAKKDVKKDAKRRAKGGEGVDRAE